MEKRKKLPSLLGAVTLGQHPCIFRQNEKTKKKILHFYTEMPYKRAARRRAAPASRRRAAVPRSTRNYRRLAGQAPLTWPEKIARYAGPVGLLAKSVSTIAGLVNSEAKYKDTSLSANFASAGATYFDLNDIAEGDGPSQRNGRVILGKQIQWRCRFAGNVSAATTTIGWALIMYKDNTALGGTPWTQVFATADPSALVNKTASDNFVILRRGVMCLTAAGAQAKVLNGFVSIKGIHSKYSGSGSTTFDNGHFFMMFISDQATNTPNVTGVARYEYYDN